MPDQPLTGLQEAFCREYVIDHNATAAIIRAGSKAKHPDVVATRMVRKSQVRAEIRRLESKEAKRAGITQAQVTEAFAEIAFLDPVEVFRDDGGIKAVRDMPASVRRSVSSVEVHALFSGSGREREQIGVVQKIKFWSKTDALDKLARHLGLYEKDNAQKAPKVLMPIIELYDGAGKSNPKRRRRVKSKVQAD